MDVEVAGKRCRRYLNSRYLPGIKIVEIAKITEKFINGFKNKLDIKKAVLGIGQYRNTHFYLPLPFSECKHTHKKQFKFQNIKPIICLTEYLF